MTFAKQTESSFPTNVLALIAGVSAGVAVGILMAPKSGAKLRAEIEATVDEYMNTARQKAEGLRTSAVNLAQRRMQDVKKAVSGAAEAHASDAHNAIDKTVAAVNEGGKKGHEAVDGALNMVRAEANS
jgi:gas vesicle protein